MIDTINYRIDLLVNGQDSINTLCHVIIRDTNDACYSNAIPMVGIICGACVVIAFIFAWWKCACEKHSIKAKGAEREYENKKRADERQYEIEDRNAEKEKKEKEREYENKKRADERQCEIENRNAERENKEKERTYELEDRQFKTDKEYMMKLFELGEKLKQKGSGLSDMDMEYIKFMAQLVGFYKDNTTEQ